MMIRMHMVNVITILFVSISMWVNSAILLRLNASVVHIYIDVMAHEDIPLAGLLSKAGLLLVSTGETL